MPRGEELAKAVVQLRVAMDALALTERILATCAGENRQAWIDAQTQLLIRAEAHRQLIAKELPSKTFKLPWEVQ